MVLARRLMVAVMIGMVVAVGVSLSTRRVDGMLDRPIALISKECVSGPGLMLAQFNRPSCWEGNQNSQAY